MSERYKYNTVTKDDLTPQEIASWNNYTKKLRRYTAVAIVAGVATISAVLYFGGKDLKSYTPMLRDHDNKLSDIRYLKSESNRMALDQQRFLDIYHARYPELSDYVSSMDSAAKSRIDDVVAKLEQDISMTANDAKFQEEYATRKKTENQVMYSMCLGLLSTLIFCGGGFRNAVKRQDLLTRETFVTKHVDTMNG
jgi:hypothetical protein